MTETPVPLPATLAAGCWYIATGYRVFVLSRSKQPVGNCRTCPPAGPDHPGDTCSCLTCHGFYAATGDPDRLAAMLDAVPDGLLAIRTGTPSGIVVVDIDPRNGGELDRDLMTPTATVATGGGGYHLYYRHPGVALVGKLPGHPGVDIKADGGYVVAPPAVHPGTGLPYRWVPGRTVVEMPSPLLAACQPVPAVTVSTGTRPTTTNTGEGISSPDALLAAHLDAVRRAPEGRRRTTLYGAARGVARMVSAGAIPKGDAITVLTEAGRNAGQTERETRAAIDGGFRDEGVTA